MFDLTKKTNQLFILIFLALIWGSSFILMKKGLHSYSPVEITLYRLFIVFIVFLPFGIKELNKVTLKTGSILLISGLIGSAVPYFLFIKAQTKIDSSLNGILNSITPLFTIMFGFILFKQKIKSRAFIGVCTGLIGASALVWVSSKGINIKKNLIYSILPIIGSACYALNLNIIKVYLKDISAVKITSWSFLLIGPVAGIYLFFNTDFNSHLVNNDPNMINFLYINILGILGTGFAVWLFNVLIKHTSSVFASSVTYLIPIVAILWGIIDGEIFTIIQAILSVLILLGVYLIKS